MHRINRGELVFGSGIAEAAGRIPPFGIGRTGSSAESKTGRIRTLKGRRTARKL